MQSLPSRKLVGPALAGLALLLVLAMLRISPNATGAFQSPLPPPSGPCFTQTTDGFTLDVWGYVTNNGGTTTITYRVTNDNKKDISYAAFGFGDWSPVAPADDTTVTGKLGDYYVEWTNDHGNPGFASIKYETEFDGLSQGASDDFVVTVFGFDADDPVQVQLKAGNARTTFDVTFDGTACDKTPPLTPTATATPLDSPLPSPTPTPWSPPPPPAVTPTAIPISLPVDNRGTLYYADFETPRMIRLYSVETDEIGNPLASPQVIPFDTFMPVDDLSVSPDGRYLVLSTNTNAQVLQFFLRTAGERVSVLTPKIFFDWHPDNEYIVVAGSMGNEFGRGLLQVDVLTGERAPLVLQQGDNPFWQVTGAAFSPDGQKLAYAGGNNIWLANANGSAPQKILDANDIWDWSFDGRYLLYTGEPLNLPKGDTSPRYALWVMDLITSERRPIFGSFIYGYGYTPILSPATHEVAFIGAEEPDDCFFNDMERRSDRFCKYRGFSLFIGNLVTGEVRQIAQNAGTPTWSPDGTAIAYTRLDTNDQLDLWITYLDEERSVQITDSPAEESAVIWFPQQP